MKRYPLIAACLVWFCASPAFAGWDHQNTFVLQPVPAHAGDILRLRIDNEVGCFDGGPYAKVQRQGSELTVDFFPVDHACPDEFRTPLLASIGSLPAGVHTMRIRLCAAPPLPCEVVDTQTLIIEPRAPRHRIPALSWSGVIVSVLGVMAAALFGAVVRGTR